MSIVSKVFASVSRDSDTQEERDQFSRIVRIAELQQDHRRRWMSQPVYSYEAIQRLRDVAWQAGNYDGYENKESWLRDLQLRVSRLQPGDLHNIE